MFNNCHQQWTGFRKKLYRKTRMTFNFQQCGFQLSTLKFPFFIHFLRCSSDFAAEFPPVKLVCQQLRATGVRWRGPGNLQPQAPCWQIFQSHESHGAFWNENGFPSSLNIILCLGWRVKGRGTNMEPTVPRTDHVLYIEHRASNIGGPTIMSRRHRIPNVAGSVQ